VAEPASELRFRSRPWLAAGAAATAYVALALWVTWPLPRRLGDHVVDTVALQGPFGWLALADILLVVWALAWDVHALVTAPLSLFDANVFHPARWALARSDHFLGNLPLFAPIYLASHNPVLAHQALLMLAFPLSALAMCLAVATWTGSFTAGFIAGLQFGFAPWRFVQLAHVQLVSTLFLPLLLLCAWATVRTGSPRAWLGVVVLAGLQALCSVYLGLAAFAAAGAMVVGTWLVAPPGSWRRAAAAAGALGLAAAPVVALAWPYISLARIGAIPRVPPIPTTLGMPLELAAAHPLRTYLLHRRPDSADGYYFLGWSCVALAALGALARRRQRAAGRSGTVEGAPPRAGLLTLLLAGWLLSLGYAWRLPGGELLPLPLGWLARVLPGFASFRAPVRLGIIVALGAAALAGIGYARIEACLRRRRWRAALAVVVGAVSVFEGVPSAIPLRPVAVGSQVPEVYRWLAAQPPGPVLELPVGFLDHDFLGDGAAVRWQSGYQYFSTAHWRPLLNGYSGYPPESFFFLMAIARRLPARDALQDLVDLSGLRWLIVHRGSLGPEARKIWEEWEDEGGAVRRGAFGDDVAFEVVLKARRDLSPLLRVETRRPQTLSGLSRAPLSGSALSGVLDALEVPRTMLAGGLQHGLVTVQNLGDRPWPGFDPVRDGLVGVGYRWRRDDGDTTPGSLITRLGRDLAPGESMRLPFGVVAPQAPGRYELVVTLRQDGGPWFDEAAGVAARSRVEVRPWPASALGR